MELPKRCRKQLPARLPLSPPSEGRSLTLQSYSDGVVKVGALNDDGNSYLLMQTCLSSLSFGLHRFFAADDVTGIDAPTDFIDHDAEAANTAFISLTLFHTLLGNLLCYLLLSHDFLLL